jgi:hypothetical protein
MRLTLFHVDAFTDLPFTGNPAAVCVLDAPADPAWMQEVAREMNLAETAFLHKQADGYRLRWFTPLVEVDLCGHATLAGAPDSFARKYASRHERGAALSPRSAPILFHPFGNRHAGNQWEAGDPAPARGGRSATSDAASDVEPLECTHGIFSRFPAQ